LIQVGLAMFSEDVSELWRFSVSELFSNNRRYPLKKRGASRRPLGGTR
jgi:hypothetical protein